MTIDTEVQDFGTSNFKSRALNTVFARITLHLKNRMLGEYKDSCFIFGRINDTNFRCRENPLSPNATTRPRSAHGKPGISSRASGSRRTERTTRARARRLHRLDNLPGLHVLFRRKFVRECNLAGLQPFRPRGLAGDIIGILRPCSAPVGFPPARNIAAPGVPRFCNTIRGAAHSAVV